MANASGGKGQTALITGASAGIGLALAECFARDGYDLILTARSAPALQTESQRLAEKYGVAATPIALDLETVGGGHKLAGEIEARKLSVDVLVNNAGYGIAGGFNGSRESEQIGMIDLNVRALVELMPHDVDERSRDGVSRFPQQSTRRRDRRAQCRARLAGPAPAAPHGPRPRAQPAIAGIVPDAR
jgi:NADP-dependent 3-hydroxy acid dehydrogenase YdfG